LALASDTSPSRTGSAEVLPFAVMRAMLGRLCLTIKSAFYGKNARR
jgi:hypothetical protein